MTDPLFTPLKSHPSTWQAEVAQLRDENTELALQGMIRNAQAREAHEARLVAEAEAEALREQLAAERNANGHEKRLRQEVIALHQRSEAEAEALRADNSRLIEERDRALAWRDKDWQASQENETLLARVAELKKALGQIAALCEAHPGVADGAGEIAKAALQEGGAEEDTHTARHTARTLPRRRGRGPRQAKSATRG